MPRSLAELTHDLGIEHVIKKGFFLYTFNRHKMKIMWARFQKKSYFGLERLPEKKRREFEIWYAEARDSFGSQYKIMDQCKAYCVNDVLVL